MRTKPLATERIVATVLAATWLGGGAAVLGIATLGVGVGGRRWLYALIGIAALCYGVVWLRVARLGRRLTWSELVRPWRAK